MKQLFLMLICISWFSSITAQAPLSFKYQAVARDAGGAMLINKNALLRVGIRDLTITGIIVYRETHSVTTNAYGIINLNIGQGTINQGSFSGINWGNGSKFVELEIDLGNGYVSIGTSQLLSVPYALYAANGPVGPQGSPGIQGIQGAQGTQGNQGIAGANGTNGISIVWLGTFSAAPTTPGLNEAYYDSIQKKSFVWNGSSWQILAQDGATGAQGPKGSSLLSVFQYVNSSLEDVTDSTDFVIYNVGSWVVLPSANAVAKGKVIIFTENKPYAGPGQPYIAARGSDVIVGGYTPSGSTTGTVIFFGYGTGWLSQLLISDGVSRWYVISN